MKNLQHIKSFIYKHVEVYKRLSFSIEKELNNLVIVDYAE